MKNCQFTHRFSQRKIPARSSTSCSERSHGLGPGSYILSACRAGMQGTSPAALVLLCPLPPSPCKPGHRDTQRSPGLAVGFQSAFLETHISVHFISSEAGPTVCCVRLGRGLAGKSGYRAKSSPATQRVPLFVKDTEISNTGGYMGNNVPK